MDDPTDSNFRVGGEDDQQLIDPGTQGMDVEAEEDGITIFEGINDLPEFASLESKALHRENLENEKNMEKLADEIDDMVNRVKVMKEHLKNVQQEVEHTNGLNGAKAAEISTEKHMQQLTSRALGRAQNESKEIQTKIEFVQEQLNTTQGLIYKANEQLDEFKLQMNWNQDELEQWSLAAKQKEEDNLALERYKRADEAKIKELTMKLEHLTKELLRVKAQLVDEDDGDCRQADGAGPHRAGVQDCSSGAAGAGHALAGDHLRDEEARPRDQRDRREVRGGQGGAH